VLTEIQDNLGDQLLQPTLDRIWRKKPKPNVLRS